MAGPAGTISTTSNGTVTMRRISLTRRRVRRLIVLGALSALLAASSLGGVASESSLWQDLRYLLSGASLAVLFAMTNFGVPYIWKIPRRSGLIVLTWVTFAVMTFASGIFNQDVHTLFEAIRYTCISLLLLMLSLPKIQYPESSKFLIVAMLVGGIPYLVWSVLTHPLTYPYAGVFANPNAMGVLSAMLASAAFTLLVGSSARKGQWHSLVFLFLVVIFLGFIMLSGSRASLAAFATMFAVMVLRLIQKGSLEFLLCRILLPIILIGVVAIVPLGHVFSQFWSGIIIKIETYIHADNPLSGRTEIWQRTFEDMRWLGNGSNYFASRVGKGPHNSIISVLGRTGFLSAVPVLIFAVASVGYAYQYATRAKSSDAFADGPLIIIVGFWSLGMAEALLAPLGQGITVAAFVAVGITTMTNDRSLSTLVREPRPGFGSGRHVSGQG